MREHPIIFSDEMVRAILEGRKTQTRRVIEPQFNRVWGSGVPVGYDRFAVHVDIQLAEPHPDFGGWAYLFCPYGRAGDRLWVRETFRQSTLEPNRFWYKADNGNPGFEKRDWKPSIHMPRAASRITLEIVKVCAERLQEISDGDIGAEGVNWSSTKVGNNHGSPARDAFASLWDSINAKRGYSWDVNPWVWVIEFRRVT